MELVLKWLATLSAALFAGGALYISIVEHPARLKAGVAVGLAEFRPSYRRAAPWQASMAAMSLVSSALAWFLTSERTWLLGGLVVGAAIPFTLLAIMPTNRRLLDTGLAGDEAAVLLRRWGRLHWVRSVLGTAGLMVLLSKAFLR
jgi:hypothetical protein